MDKPEGTSSEVVTKAGLFKQLWHFIVVGVIAFKWMTIDLFTRHRKLNLQVVPKRSSETAVITGGARGIGAEAVKQLMMLDMHVIIGCRNPSAGVKMVDDIRKDGIQTGTAEILALDLHSFDSVREFSQILLDRNLPISILINNAGIMFGPYNVTKDGFQSQLQTNYLSHFLLTTLLLPLLTLAGTPGRASRIVNVSSCAHFGGHIDFKDLNMSKSYSESMAYMASKLMQVVSTKELDARMTSEGKNVRVYAVHPGVVNTNLYSNVWGYAYYGWSMRAFMITPEQGSDGVVYVALAPEIENQGGAYFTNCKIYNPNSKSNDLELQKQLWNISKELVGVSSTDAKDTVDITTDLK